MCLDDLTDFNLYKAIKRKKNLFCQFNSKNLIFILIATLKLQVSRSKSIKLPIFVFENNDSNTMKFNRMSTI